MPDQITVESVDFAIPLPGGKTARLKVEGDLSLEAVKYIRRWLALVEEPLWSDEKKQRESEAGRDRPATT